ncbi:MAG: BspA family leucine-rich repeat surface protein [Clostridiales bacterium]|nr:BspA family leucine-rich repeat surface protein [Clostridiales bacterium]
MEITKCTKCMMDLGEGVLFCPHCGYDQQREEQPANALRRNTILRGRYLVGNVIGQGGFGITYVGFDLVLEMKVAIKEYYPSATASRTGSHSSRIQWDTRDEEEQAKGIARFVKEAQRMAKLDAVPSIVRVWDVFQENDTAYIVMDFVEGVTLNRYIKDHGVMHWTDCFALLEPLLESLAVMHDRGFIHRDISPDNIMVQPDGTARLLDMGAAVDVSAAQGQASMAVAKKHFSAPEQYTQSAALGSWSDVYGMAATMYYCLTGKVIPEAMERSFNKVPIQFPAEYPMPSHVAAALTGALELETNARTRDMREFKRQLASLTPPPPAKKIAKIILVPVFALIALCIILGGVNRVSSSGTHTLMSDSLVEYDDDIYYVLGSEEWRRDEITSVTFLDTRADEPDDSWDVSDEQDGSVKAWVDESDGADLYIAAKGGVILPEDCEDLFNYYENMTEIDLTGVDTSNVTSMNGMFYYCHSLEALDVSGFDTSNVTDMAFMFSYCIGLTSLDVSGFDTSSVTDMMAMFYCTGLTSLDLSTFDTSAVTRLNYMFAYSSALTQVNTDGFDLSNAETMLYMYAGCTNLSKNVLMSVSDDDSSSDPVFGSDWVREQISTVTFLSTLEDEPDDSWDVSEAGDGSVKAWMTESGDDCNLYIAADGGVRLPADSGYLFGNYLYTSSIDMAGVDTSGVVDMSYMFYKTDLTELDVSGFDTSNVQSMEGMFSGCLYLTELDVSGFDTSNVQNMEGMFSDCRVLTSLDVGGFDTLNVTDMSYMFHACYELTSLDVSGFDTSNVTDMSHMFCYCTELQEADVSNFNTSRVTDMSNLFENCKSLTVIDVSGFDTSNVTDMSSMFSLCASVKELDVSGFDTSQVTSMSCMFDFAQGCSLTELDITGFDTSQVTNMRCMFLGCTVTDLSVDDFDTSNVTDMFRMFKNCTGLGTLNVSNFDTSQVTTMEEMFYGCQNLLDLDLSGFDISNVSEEEDWSIFLYDCSSLKTLLLWEGISTELKAELYEQAEIFISPDFGGVG